VYPFADVRSVGRPIKGSDQRSEQTEIQPPGWEGQFLGFCCTFIPPPTRAISRQRIRVPEVAVSFLPERFRRFFSHGRESFLFCLGTATAPESRTQRKYCGGARLPSVNCVMLGSLMPQEASGLSCVLVTRGPLLAMQT